MPKIGFPMPTAKNQFQILNLHPKNMYLKKPERKKKHGLKGKNYHIYIYIVTRDDVWIARRNAVGIINLYPDCLHRISYLNCK